MSPTRDGSGATTLPQEDRSRTPELAIPIDKLRALILEARRLDVKEGDTDPDSGSDAIDDMDRGVLSSSDEEDASEHEFRGMVAGLNIDERADLLALIYIGRGDFTADAWDEARSLAAERDAESLHLGNYLVGTPNLPDLIDEGLTSLGFSFEDDGPVGPDDEVVEIRHGRKN